uniref:3CxxC-type domain-containing protein n=1 Tax=Strombidium rassoulzadegani TaxID=1082188 RepID=A0A7S3FYB2_9SPIT|mmetsp:Transcript_9720/g.16372  ORF Transcript_9720/g.16372 Transcript_9720/m.16372 type:complete len:227 (+) Transcript_9720:36-716(+)
MLVKELDENQIKRIQKEQASVSDLTELFINNMSSDVLKDINDDHVVKLHAGNFTNVSRLKLYFLGQQQDTWEIKSFSTVAKFICTNSQCDQVMWSSSRATLELIYMRPRYGIYQIVVRAYKRVCQKCGTLAEIEIDMEESYDRLRFLIANEIKVSISKDWRMKNALKRNIKEILCEPMEFEADEIEEITPKMVYYHNMHQKSCSACLLGFCVYLIVQGKQKQQFFK